MKWAQLANVLVPIIGAFVPGFAPFVPIVQGGIQEAQQLHGSGNNGTKQEHVENIVALAAKGVQDSGRATLDPATAVAVTRAVFSTIDGVKKVVDANQHHAPVAAKPL